MNLHYQRFRSLQALCLALTVFLSTTGLISTRVHAATLNKTPDVDSFIIEYVGGKSVCRKATPAEVPSTLPRPTDIGVPVERLLPPTKNASANAVGTGLTINFVALSQLQANPNSATIIAAFQRAASVWTARIKNPVTITINIDYGPNSPGGSAFGPTTLGSTVSDKTLIDYPGARTNLLAGSSGPDETAVYNALPTSFVPTDTGNGGVVTVNRSVAFALGIPVSGATQVVATMGFNSAFPFDFNPDDGVTPGQTDFNSVATHEIGHALGFVSGAGQGSTSGIALWDIFRFRPGTTPGTFTSAQRLLSIGGTQVYYTGQTFVVAGAATTELGLSTGGPAGVTSGGGDGNQSSHWKADELSGKFIGIMDPSIASGVHEDVTENDFMALEMIGWNLINTVAPPPPPPAPPTPPNDNFANAQVITGCSGSVDGTNVGATAETGEPQHFPPGGGGLGGGKRSVWYRWQAPSTGQVSFTTAGSRFDTVLAVYTGSSVSSLTLAAPPADDIPTDKTSLIPPFNVTAGTTYRIAVDGYDNDSGGDFGPLTLNWTESNCAVAPSPQILLEDTGPAIDQAAVFDSVLWLRDPFSVINTANLINPAADPNTRLVIFVTNLTPGAPVTVNLVDSANVSRDVTASDVHDFTDFSFVQVTFRLPSGMATGTCHIKVVSQNLTSNTATFRIGP